MELRKYQKEAVEASISNYIQGTNRQLYVLPCGAGKTVIFVSIIKRYFDIVGSAKVVIVCHRDYLLEQAFDKLERLYPELSKGFHDWTKDICLTTPIKAKNNRKLMENVDICILDESHHSTAPTYLNFLSPYFLKSKKKLLIGVTATPRRLDKQGLNKIFQKIVYQKSVGWMIEHGYQVHLIAKRINIGAPLRGVYTHAAGDFSPGASYAVLKDPPITRKIVELYKKYLTDKKTIIFASNITHGDLLQRAFTKNEIECLMVSSKVTKEVRADRLTKFRLGEIKLMINVQILTEGYDDPSVEAVIVARLTASESLYTQMVGRAMRPHPGKKYGYIIDITDNDHKLLTSSDIDGLGLMKCDHCNKYCNDLHPEKQVGICSICKKYFCNSHGSLHHKECMDCRTLQRCDTCWTETYQHGFCKYCREFFCSKHGNLKNEVCYKCIPPREQKRKEKKPLKKSERLHLFTSLNWEVNHGNYYYYTDKIKLSVFKKEERYRIRINNKVSKDAYCLEYAMELLERFLIERDMKDKLVLVRKATYAQKCFLLKNGYNKDIKKVTFNEARSFIIQFNSMEGKRRKEK